MAREFFPRPPARRGPGIARLWAEAFFFTFCALLLANGLHVPQSGFFAIFLAAAALTGRLDELLDKNRVAIISNALAPWRANTATAAGVLGLFLGIFAAFLVAALYVGEARMASEYRFVVEVAGLGGDTILTRSFAAAFPLFVHNALVLLVFVTLAFVYRSYGALLVLSWNACVWGLVLAFLTRRGVAASHVHPALFVAVAVLAVVPHLVLEAAGYVFGSLGAIFASKAALKYSPRQPVFRSVMRSAAILAGLGIACLLVAAVVESILPRGVLSLLLR